ncbi:hypothetical protein BKA70DRAFT_1448181 [Coprinopsis sp. MPI-PUGE-AT-0042]|nr:hypothetical protein BKA70DRAFT_1448181 [Coprinopsis sp. MPI-PUGE-AT-0042]
MPSLTLEDARKALKKKTLTKWTFQRFNIGILAKLCSETQYPVIPTGTTKDDYIAAILHGVATERAPQSENIDIRSASLALDGPAVGNSVGNDHEDLEMDDGGMGMDTDIDIDADANGPAVATLRDMAALADGQATEDIATILPFIEGFDHGSVGQEVRIRLYDKPRGWKPTLEVDHVTDSDGSIDLGRLAQELHGGERVLKAIHPVKLRPIYEYQRGRISGNDVADLMEEGGLRVCFME